ncbi:glycosyltransferase [bacterium]|nr:glycosyltransferase [bacterium]
MGITVTILTYNEEENIKELIPQVKEQLVKLTDDYEILVVDSPNSKDNSKDVCEKNNVKYYLQEGPYFIDALKTAIKYASKDIFLYIDADFSHPPEYIPDIYNAFISNNADLVIGSRYVKGGSTDDFKKNIIYSKVLNLIYKILSGDFKTNDISGGYKMYKTSVLKNMKLWSRYFEMQIEIFIKAKLANPEFKVVEVPIHFKQREKGCSKRNYFKYLPSFLKVFIKLFFYKIFYRVIK